MVSLSLQRNSAFCHNVMSLDPLITILVCTRDRPAPLVRCLESIYGQKFDSYEVIVVDNASRSFSIPEMEYRRKTRFFSYAIPGLSRARNAILPEVRGEFLAMLDDDATADADWLNKAVSHFDHPDVGCVTGKILPLQLKTEWQEKQVDDGWESLAEKTMIYDRTNFDPLTSCPGKGTNIFVRMSLAKEIGFPEIFGPGTPTFAADEHYLFYEIVKNGMQIRYEPNSLVYHDYVSTREEYRDRVFRCTVSRGAFLMKFLLSESGYRLKTWKHMLTKLLPGRRAGAKQAFYSRTTGFLTGPFALIRSAWRVRNSSPQGCTFLAEFPGNSSRTS